MMKQKKGMITEKIADGYMIVPTEGDNVSNIVSINQSGFFVWNQLAEDKSFAELTQLLMEQYDISRKEAETDLKEFLNIMKDYLIIE